MKKILIVEDEKEIQELLSAYLHNEGYETYTADDGLAALQIFNKYDFDLVLLDIMLPKVDGYTVCEGIRRISQIPIMMISALDDVKYQLKGFDCLVDDYITKPFNMALLCKKIAVLLRRSKKKDEQQKIHYKDILLNLSDHEAYVQGQKIELTKIEFQLLSELLQHPGRVFTRELLLERVWDYHVETDERIVDCHIKNLRKKLMSDCIETIRGVGYRVQK